MGPKGLIMYHVQNILYTAKLAFQKCLYRHNYMYVCIRKYACHSAYLTTFRMYIYMYMYTYTCIYIYYTYICCVQLCGEMAWLEKFKSGKTDSHMITFELYLTMREIAKLSEHAEKR